MDCHRKLLNSRQDATVNLSRRKEEIRKKKELFLPWREKCVYY